MIQFDVGGLFTQFKGMKPQPRMGRFETVQKPDGFLAVRTGLRPEDIDIEAGVALHAGSLPRPDDLIELNRVRLAEGFGDEAAFQERLRTAVMDVVTRQQNLGIDISGDGEYGKAMGHRVNYGAWWSYSFQRLGGLELTGPGLYEMPAHRSEPGQIRVARARR